VFSGTGWLNELALDRADNALLPDLDFCTQDQDIGTLAADLPGAPPLLPLPPAAAALGASLDASRQILPSGTSGGQSRQPQLTAAEAKLERRRAQNRAKQQRYRERQQVRPWGSAALMQLPIQNASWKTMDMPPRLPPHFLLFSGAPAAGGAGV
jgi:hypothetical protein